MDLEKFVEDCCRTESKVGEDGMHLTQRQARLLHAGMGLATEAGEFLDQLKKHIFYGKGLDTVNLVEEMGDANWYVGLACDELETAMEYVLKSVIGKLKARYPEHFTPEAALNRDLDLERKTLEQGGKDASSI